MAESSVIAIPQSFQSGELQELPPTPSTKSPMRTPRPIRSPSSQNPSQASSVVIDKTLSSAANLVKFLPSGTVLAFQALSPSFSNKGACYTSNRYLTGVLILVCSITCLFFSFTDSVKGNDGKIYYGIATFKGLYLFNFEGSDEEKAKVFKDLKRFRLRILDYVHAIFSIIVFLTLTFSDADIQNCLFPAAGSNAKELLVNLPLGAAVMSTLVFMTFPTSRKGIGYSDATPHA